MYGQFLNKNPILLPGNDSLWLLDTTSEQLTPYSMSYLFLSEKQSVFTSEYISLPASCLMKLKIQKSLFILH